MGGMVEGRKKVMKYFGLTGQKIHPWILEHQLIYHSARSRSCSNNHPDIWMLLLSFLGHLVCVNLVFEALFSHSLFTVSDIGLWLNDSMHYFSLSRRSQSKKWCDLVI